ncbi:MAG TPA: hypothetical protein VEM93_03805 [Actinomycetota bacterium]|nr:hypothetical protein [Actinomycetota bacterium]
MAPASRATSSADRNFISRGTDRGSLMPMQGEWRRRRDWTAAFRAAARTW